MGEHSGGGHLGPGGLKKLDAVSKEMMTCAGKKPCSTLLRIDSVCVSLVFLWMKWSFQTGSVSSPKSFLPGPPLLTGLCAVAK